MPDGASGSPFVVVDERVVPRSAYRPSPFEDLADTPAWWASLVLLGALTIVAAGLLGARDGEATAIGGVVLFLATAVVAGLERAEAATALAISGLLWTSAGISMAAGFDGDALATGIGFAVAGIGLVGIGSAGLVRALRTQRRVASAAE